MNKLKTNRTNIAKTLRSYSMIIVLIAIVALFEILTGGKTLKPRNLTNIILLHQSHDIDYRFFRISTANYSGTPHNAAQQI